MNPRLQTFLWLTGSLLFLLSCTTSNGSTIRVYWLGSKEFEKLKSSFALTAAQAQTLLVEKLQAKHGEWRKRIQLLAIVDDSYLFGAGEKASLSLTGYYVKGDGSTVEFRKTDLKPLGHGQQPNGTKIFQETEKL